MRSVSDDQRALELWLDGATVCPRYRTPLEKSL